MDKSGMTITGISFDDPHYIVEYGRSEGELGYMANAVAELCGDNRELVDEMLNHHKNGYKIARICVSFKLVVHDAMICAYNARWNSGSAGKRRRNPVKDYCISVLKNNAFFMEGSIGLVCHHGEPVVRWPKIDILEPPSDDPESVWSRFSGYVYVK